MGKPGEKWPFAIKALVAARNLRVGSAHAMTHPAGWTPVIFLPVCQLQSFSELSVDGDSARIGPVPEMNDVLCGIPRSHG